MIENKERIIIHLNTSVSGIFKILPLFEERNIGFKKYVESLLFELYGLDKVIDIKYSHEYISLLSTLESIKSEFSNYEIFISVVECMKNNLNEATNDNTDKLTTICMYEEHSETILHSTIKREVFKCINIIKNMITKYKEGA